MPELNRKIKNSSRLVFLFFLLVYLLTWRGVARGADETVMLTTIQNIYHHGSFAIDELKPLQEKLVIGALGPDGHLYGKYPLGNTIFGLPLYAIGELLLKGAGSLTVTLLNPLLGAICMLLLFNFLKSKFSIRTALVSTLLLGLCTDWWFASRGFGSETGAGLFLLASFIAANQGHAAWSAASFSLSFLFRTINLVAFPVLGMNYICKGKKALYYLGIVVFAGLATLVFNYLRYGNLLNFGYAGESFSINPFVGIFNLLFSPGRSLFLYSPILILAIPGAVIWWKRDRLQTLFLLGSVVLYIVAIGFWHAWDGGWSWGARLLVPILPLLAVLVSAVVEKLWSKPWLAAVVGLLGLVGFGIGLLTLFQDPLLTLQHAIMDQGIPYENTLFTFKNSNLALQFNALKDWQPSMLDSLFLKLIFHGY